MDGRTRLAAINPLLAFHVRAIDITGNNVVYSRQKEQGILKGAMMILRYEEVVKNPERFLAFTGHTQEEFEQVLPSFEAAWEEHRATYHRAIERRKRAVGGGRRGQVHRVEDKLLFILVYFKVYPLQEVQGMLFGMGQSQAGEWIHRLTEVLHATLQRDLLLPARDAATLESVLAACESHSFVIDGTERPTQRSSDDAVQRAHYSGKKKRTRLKTWSSATSASGKSAS